MYWLFQLGKPWTEEIVEGKYLKIYFFTVREAKKCGVLPIKIIHMPTVILLKPGYGQPSDSLLSTPPTPDILLAHD